MTTIRRIIKELKELEELHGQASLKAYRVRRKLEQFSAPAPSGEKDPEEAAEEAAKKEKFEQMISERNSKIIRIASK